MRDWSECVGRRRVKVEGNRRVRVRGKKSSKVRGVNEVEMET